MRKKSVAYAVAALMTAALIGASSASAASEFGDNCAANETTELGESATLFALTAAGDPLPLIAPSDGVITKWSLNAAPELPPAFQTLEVVRQTGPSSVLVVGKSGQNISPGSNSFDTRIPVKAGDHLGLSAGAGVPLLFCLVPGPKNLLAVFLSAPTGSTVTLAGETEAEARVPAVAVLEPDADNDGYGDETQDKCPQSAASQAACPVVAPIPPVALGTSAKIKKALVNVLVTSSPQASVTVAGTVKLGKGKSVKLSGGTQVVTPGAIAKFTLLFSEKLKAKLQELSRKQFLWLNLGATAPNSAGVVATSNLKVKLKGQAKPKPKKQHGAKGKVKPRG